MPSTLNTQSENTTALRTFVWNNQTIEFDGTDADFIKLVNQLGAKEVVSYEDLNAGRHRFQQEIVQKAVKSTVEVLQQSFVNNTDQVNVVKQQLPFLNDIPNAANEMRAKRLQNLSNWFDDIANGKAQLIALPSTKVVKNVTIKSKDSDIKIKPLLITVALAVLTGGVARGFGF